MSAEQWQTALDRFRVVYSAHGPGFHLFVHRKLRKPRTVEEHIAHHREWAQRWDSHYTGAENVSPTLAYHRDNGTVEDVAVWLPTQPAAWWRAFEAEARFAATLLTRQELEAVGLRDVTVPGSSQWLGYLIATLAGTEFVGESYDTECLFRPIAASMHAIQLRLQAADAPPPLAPPEEAADTKPGGTDEPRRCAMLYQRAIEDDQSLRTDRQVWDHLGESLERNELPAFDAFRKSLVRARQMGLLSPKNTRRKKGRATGRSVIRRDQL